MSNIKDAVNVRDIDSGPISVEVLIMQTWFLLGVRSLAFKVKQLARNMYYYVYNPQNYCKPFSVNSLPQLWR